MATKGQKHLSIEARDELVSRAKAGVPHDDLAIAFGIKIRQVKRIVSAATPPEERLRAKLAERRAIGLSEAAERPFSEVAKELGVDRTTVWRWKKAQRLTGSTG